MNATGNGEPVKAKELIVLLYIQAAFSLALTKGPFSASQQRHIRRLKLRLKRRLIDGPDAAI
jgi:hypothetical protein